MNMKTIALSATLMLAAAVPAVQAQVHKPTPGSDYTCTYTNPAMQEKSPGTSIFNLASYFGGTLLRGIELYEATNPTRQDNRKVSFSEPLDIPKPDGSSIVSTLWNFSIDPGGPTCVVLVKSYGKTLIFAYCSDGSARTCTRVW